MNLSQLNSTTFKASIAIAHPVFGAMTWETMLGDDKQVDYFPQAKLIINGCHFSERLIIPDYFPKNSDLSVSLNELRLVTGSIEPVYRLVDGVEGGVFETEINILSKPVTSQLMSTLVTENISVAYQAPLNELPANKLPADLLSATPTEAIFASGDVITRAEHIAGSYNVISLIDGRKIMSIHRPQITDSEGRSEYCTLDINMALKQQTVSWSKDFNDTAVLPWVIK